MGRQNGASQTRFFKMQYRKKELKDEVYFLHADKQRSLLRSDTIILGECNWFLISNCPDFAWTVPVFGMLS